MDKRIRCSWCNLKNPRYVTYHDEEWGTLNLEDGYLYEMLLLESFQAGLSWECVLNKREAFRRAFDGFSAEKICHYGEEKVNSLLSDKGIIRNRWKILAAVENSGIFLKIVAEFGSFGEYLRAFAGEGILYETEKTTNALSDAVSADLKKRGMKFMGSTVVYSFLQAVGLICSHEKECYLFGGNDGTV